MGRPATHPRRGPTEWATVVQTVRTDVCACIHTRSYIRTHARANVRTCIHTHAHAYIHTSSYKHSYVRTFVRTCVHPHKYTINYPNNEHIVGVRRSTATRPAHCAPIALHPPARPAAQDFRDLASVEWLCAFVRQTFDRFSSAPPHTRGSLRSAAAFTGDSLRSWEQRRC
jgi:hypothetical protein